MKTTPHYQIPALDSRSYPLLAALAALVLAPVAPAEETTAAPPKAGPVERKPDVVYVPTPQAVVDKMLAMAEVKKGDIVYDLGCGDGRIVVTAAKKYGVKAVGFDIDPARVKEARKNVEAAKVGHLVTIKQQDIFKLDLSEATVVALYLLPELNVRLMPQLAKLKPGSRIVSHDFDMGTAKPVEVHKLDASDAEDEDDSWASSHTIYKWVVPWETKKAGPAEQKPEPSSGASE
jgi:SAM-dependent methyltransferase